MYKEYLNVREFIRIRGRKVINICDEKLERKKLSSPFYESNASNFSLMLILFSFKLMDNWT